MKIIAECGVNWRSLEEAFLMIKKAKEVGCWAAKFQLFKPSQIDKKLPLDLYLTKEDAKLLFVYGKSIGQEVFFTPMFLEAVEWCEEIGVNYYKVRYKDRSNFNLINKIKDTLKPYFRSINNDYSVGIDEIPLFCIPKYPAKLIDYLFEGSNEYRGISDHTSDLELLKLFYEKYEGWDNDRYFEKHVKLDDDCIESDWSVTFEALAEVLK